MKLTKKTVAIAVAIVAVLGVSFWYGGAAPNLHSLGTGATPAASESVPPTQTAEPTPSILPTATPAESLLPTPSTTPTATAAVALPEAPVETSAAADEETGEKHAMTQGLDQYGTEPVPEGKPKPVEPEDVTISDTAYTCTLTVRCDTLLEHLDWLNPEKTELVPEDGVLFPTATVTFYEGESVFNVLRREMKKAKIHMEFENTPLYHSAYLEGIGNLYEFDCGELSGWMYRVNDWAPNYGCSRYALQDGDKVEWLYTCDLGADLGAGV